MDWTRGRILGHGSFATVSLASGQHSGEVFAVKSTEFSKSELLGREAEILSKLNFPQIISYQGSNVTNENGKSFYNLCMEFASGGTLSDEIRRHGGRLLENTLRSYTCQILKGLAYLHTNKTVHCDIKSSNVLITSGGFIKIGDLGCAKIVDDDDVSSCDSSTITGTPLFMAPEVARGEQQGCPADIWALGCTIIEMATGQAPWAFAHGSDPVSVLYRIGFSGDLPEIPTYLSKDGQDFLCKCFVRDPLERWSATQLLDHDFLKKSEFDPNQDYGSNLDTPTSVLDPIFWESKNNTETTIFDAACEPKLHESAMERIRQLCEEGSNTSNCDWDLEEEWVQVRNNIIIEMLYVDDEFLTSERFEYDLLDENYVLGNCEMCTCNSNGRNCCNYGSQTNISSLLRFGYIVDGEFYGNFWFEIIIKLMHLAGVIRFIGATVVR